jgi:hypothetical protein
LNCSYCGVILKKKENRTKEHIIPEGIIKLFPDCDIAYTPGGAFIGEAVIKDVCKNCNNVILSKLDTYGKQMVIDYFLESYSPGANLNFHYDFNLLARWFLKIIFNSKRANKEDTAWFIKNVDYILGEKEKPSVRFTLLGGLFVNMSPFPESFNGEMPVNVINNPVFVPNGPVKVNGKRISVEPETVDYPGVHQKFLIRIGSGLFVLILWEEGTTDEQIQDAENDIVLTYPYSKLLPDHSCIVLTRATDPINSFGHALGLIHGYKGMEVAERVTIGMLGGSHPIVAQEKFSQVVTDERIKEGKKMIKDLLFPRNNK